MPEPENITLETKDGMSIRATWYAGTAKKESVPIIMVHGWEGQRGEYHGLAIYLQGIGHSIIAPDLRGHGESNTRRSVDGSTKPLEADSLTRRDLEAMVWDVEACKAFLMDKNNAGECNIASLCVVGAEFGCIVAMRWAVVDWSWPQLPAYQQGQDVQALVLLSPAQAFKGITMRDAIAHPLVRSRISVLLVAGKEDAKGTSEAKRLHGSLQAFHAKAAGNSEEDEEKLDLRLFQPVTSVQGTKLLARGLPTTQEIGQFITRRLVDRKGDFPWTERKNPLGN